MAFVDLRKHERLCPSAPAGVPVQYSRVPPIPVSPGYSARFHQTLHMLPTFARGLTRCSAGGMSTQKAQLGWREGRRRRTWEQKHQGWKQQDITVALGMTPDAVSQRLKRCVEGLRRHRVPGRQPRLTAEQLARSACAHGTLARSVRISRGGVDLEARGRGDPAHVRLHLPSRPRQPEARTPSGTASSSPSSGRVPPWWRERWPSLGKNGRRGLHQRLAETSPGSRLLPMAIRTWAPCGQTPILRVPLTRDQLRP